jgi:hypothetical protein
MCRKSAGDKQLLPYGGLTGELEGAPILPLREGKNFIMQGNFYGEFYRYIKMFRLMCSSLHKIAAGRPRAE